VEIIVIHQPIIPDPSVDARLINNLRRARLDLQEVDIQLEAIIARFDETLHQQRLERIKKKQKS
jgi:hypothetical protein